MLGVDGGEPSVTDSLTASDDSDRRVAARHTLLIRAAKLELLGVEYLCILCDASETGAKVRVFHPLPQINNTILELQNGDRLEAEIVWRKDDKAGMRFLRRTDMARILEVEGRFNKRPIRVRLAVPATLQAGNDEIECRMIDISRQGAKLMCTHPLALRQSVKLKAAGLPLDVSAKVCWRRGDQIGLSFQTVYQFFELARVVHDLQCKPRKGEGTI